MINVKIRDGNVASRPIYVILGVTADGERDILGLWAGEHGDGEGAKYWLRVLTEVKNRGTRDVLMVVCDGLKGLPDAIAQAWPGLAAGHHPDLPPSSTSTSSSSASTPPAADASGGATGGRPP